MVKLFNRNLFSQIFRYSNTHLGHHQIRTMSVSSDEVLFEVKDSKGLIKLNRPKVLNSLNLNMIRLIYSKLCQWDSDPNIKMMIIRSTSEKAFCAGGDVRAIAESGPNSKLGQDFFREEYTLDHKISILGVPYISLINGVCMGGGVGISVHGPFRVITEKTMFAMPETQIGFFCDVGGSHFLPKLPGKIGMYLGLTGHRLKGLDIIRAGIGTHFVPSSQLDALENDLIRIENPNAAKISHLLSKYQEQWESEFKQEFSLKPYLGRINSVFGSNSVEEIFEKLSSDSSSWAKEILEDLKKMSPMSLKLTFELLKRGQGKSLPDCLSMEYRLAQNILQMKDFYSGVGARLITKTNDPKWEPETIQEITDEQVQSMFNTMIPKGVRELEF
ncbi:3-hydroxyisobutyryl-CoA hydrolase, mitochondrial-like protein [Sarcoptes scabiei]|uniref:3-hydroxyisobutyryl-CoA hydrolase, mitochondrial n=1 Tax=Sarcoptes scabiei TaxID=52283 RepID=A0A132A0U3_SARSC|nr:3-hydroxyisobutyryl-CoA hydrolase, mitochondrial-like protein [Sarcoptes scabiei]